MSSFKWPIVFAVVFALYWVSLVVYRLFFHPLAKFPGPKLAASSYLYEYYFDLVKSPGGQFYRHVEDLHRQYGPVVRINPDEIQVDDIHWYGTIFSGAAAGRREKHLPMIRANGSPYAVASAQTHELHRMRRAALNPFFSKRAVQRLEPIITDKVDKLCSQIRGCYERGEVIQLDAAYMALTLDVITGYSFGDPWGALESPESWKKWHSLMYQGFETVLVARHLPWLFMMMGMMPMWMTERMNPGAAIFLNTKERIRRRVAELLREHEAAENGNVEKKRDQESLTVFEEVLNSDLPPAEKDIDHLTDNGFVLIGAGGETSATLLTHLAYHVLSNEDILKRLKAELYVAIPNSAILPEWRELEALPYLIAIVKESLRIAGILTTRLTQIAPDEDLKYGDYIIPKGVGRGICAIIKFRFLLQVLTVDQTPISYNLTSLLSDAKTFKDPEKFDPERWMRDDLSVDKLFFPFSKGTRNCLGMK